MVKAIDVKTLPSDKPFLLLEGKSEDFIKAFGNSLRYLHLCARCGTPIPHKAKVVYIAVLDAVVCIKCADKFIANTYWYSEEAYTEQCNYDKAVQKLKDSKLWKG